MFLLLSSPITDDGDASELGLQFRIHHETTCLVLSRVSVFFFSCHPCFICLVLRLMPKSEHAMMLLQHRGRVLAAIASLIPPVSHFVGLRKR